MKITLAALAALSGNDVENFIVASTPGGIEAQEQAGQRALVNNATLPIELNGCTRAQVEAMGIVYGNAVDDLFVNVTLPAGWMKQATEHHMWSDLLDDKGRKRAAIFYKAAFYDRRADMHLVRAVNITRRYHDDETVDVAVVRGDQVLFATEKTVRDLEGRDYFDAMDAAEKRAQAWADAHYPDWQSYAAYWE